MRIILRAEFPNGHFGDPALYVWEINGKGALLFDCGDLTRLSTAQLLRVSHIFLSHCHVDHFFGFDLFLRVHIGSETSTTIVGPPDTSKRVNGKLQGYTWNLIFDQNLEFVAVDLDPERSRRSVTRFHAKNAFSPTETIQENWDPREAVLDAGTYRVYATMIDHRTPSMAYAIEEKDAVAVNGARLKDLGLKPGPWIDRLKTLHLFGGLNGEEITVRSVGGEEIVYSAATLASDLLIPRGRQKLAYVTDGAAHDANREILEPFIRGADALYGETCFVRRNQPLAELTKHFTAEFMGNLATECGVKKLIPFHFSKRYLGRSEVIFEELAAHFRGEVLHLVPRSPRQRL